MSLANGILKVIRIAFYGSGERNFPFLQNCLMEAITGKKQDYRRSMPSSFWLFCLVLQNKKRRLEVFAKRFFRQLCGMRLTRKRRLKPLKKKSISLNHY